MESLIKVSKCGLLHPKKIHKDSPKYARFAQVLRSFQLGFVNDFQAYTLIYDIFHDDEKSQDVAINQVQDHQSKEEIKEVASGFKEEIEVDKVDVDEIVISEAEESENGLDESAHEDFQTKSFKEETEEDDGEVVHEVGPDDFQEPICQEKEDLKDDNLGQEENSSPQNGRVKRISNLDTVYTEYKTSNGKTAFKCKACHKCFDDEMELLRHLSRVHHIRVSMKPCPECGKTFKSTIDRKIHVKTAHAKDGSLLSLKTVEKYILGKKSYKRNFAEIAEDIVKEGSAVYKCGKCQRSYRVQATLVRHLRYECGIESSYFCGICERPFKRKDVLKAHIIKCLEKRNTR